jgi:non-specific serine/threonine protein kinase/serine/threonine-protein kinase
LATAEVIARFESERQALALMNHPNIAKVFDAGMDEIGRSFFVLEYVPGISITEYCDKHRLPLQKRLTIFIQVCNAIQHAHIIGGHFSFSGPN